MKQPENNLSTEILPTHTPALFQAAVLRAAGLLRAGELVALPTETVYGLAAKALDAGAVAKIFAVKGRPANNPVIVHVASVEMARNCAANWPSHAEAMARAFWPGPLTLVLPRAKIIPDPVTAGGPTVGIRWPGHPFIQAVIRECGFPLAAPSANLSNGISPTNAGHVARALGGKIKLIVDGGQSQVGIESTVLDLSGERAWVLRPGMIHAESLRAVLPDFEWRGAEAETARGLNEPLRSPGRLPKHYSPKAKLEIRSWAHPDDLQSLLQGQKTNLAKVHVIAHTMIPSAGEFGRVSVIPHDAEAFARAIYAELHECDEMGAERIIVETLPETNEWEAIADRLRRAAS